MKSLVGYTGFVGSNLTMQCNFEGLYNSKNIQEAYGTKPDLLIYSGVRAEKYIANCQPEKDYDTISEAFSNIKRINPRKLILISTIDVYKDPIDVDEDSKIEIEGLQPYGYNRYMLERMVTLSGLNTTIIRLPGLYGRNIKKNFIYDLINLVPAMLAEKKYLELCVKDSFISSFYENQNNGFFKCKKLNDQEKSNLKEYFNRVGFSAINFTDSRSVFQFYNLAFLWEHINIALENQIKLINLVTEPIYASELFFIVKGYNFINELNKPILHYNIHTKYDEFFKSKHNYIADKNSVMYDIKEFVNRGKNEE